MKTFLIRGALALFLLASVSLPSISNAFFGDPIGQVLGDSTYHTTQGEVLGVNTSGLTDQQINAILSLLLSFGADQETIEGVEFALRGSISTPPTISGTLTAAVDSASPAYALVAGGSTNITLGAFTFHATGEQIVLGKVRVALAEGSPTDVAKITLWNGPIKVGEGVFVGNNHATVVTLSSPVVIRKDSSVTLTVKGDIAHVGIGQPTSSGTLVRVGLQFGFGDFYGTGSSSGQTIHVTGNTTVAEGVRIFKSFPTIGLESLPSSGVQDGRLLRFKITASPQGDISIGKVKVNIAASGASVSNAQLYGYVDYYSLPVSGFGPSGQLATHEPIDGFVFANPLRIPAGSTRYFQIISTVSPVAGSNITISATLNGDHNFPGDSGTLLPFSAFTGGKDAGFVWSPHSFSASSFLDADWTNGFGVAGLPSSGLVQTRSATAVVVSKPDLTATMPLITGGTTSIKVGDYINFSADIHNGGTVSTKGFTAVFEIDYDNNGSVDLTRVRDNFGTPIEPGGFTTRTGNWTALEGTHSLRICVDTTNIVSEVSEGNNCSDKNIFTVQPK